MGGGGGGYLKKGGHQLVSTMANWLGGVDNRQYLLYMRGVWVWLAALCVTWRHNNYIVLKYE